jgi:hypothetical protein
VVRPRRDHADGRPRDGVVGLERRGAHSGKKLVEASGEAQALALASKHLGFDPYRLFHLDVDEDKLPPHPAPQAYRMLIYAMAHWLEDKEDERTKVVVESNGMQLLKIAAGAGGKRRSR